MLGDVHEVHTLARCEHIFALRNERHLLGICHCNVLMWSVSVPLVGVDRSILLNAVVAWFVRLISPTGALVRSA